MQLTLTIGVRRNLLSTAALHIPIICSMSDLRRPHGGGARKKPTLQVAEVRSACSIRIVSNPAHFCISAVPPCVSPQHAPQLHTHCQTCMKHVAPTCAFVVSVSNEANYLSAGHSVPAAFSIDFATTMTEIRIVSQILAYQSLVRFLSFVLS